MTHQQGINIKHQQGINEYFYTCQNSIYNNMRREFTLLIVAVRNARNSPEYAKWFYSKNATRKVKVYVANLADASRALWEQHI